MTDSPFEEHPTTPRAQPEFGQMLRLNGLNVAWTCSVPAYSIEDSGM